MDKINSTKQIANNNRQAPIEEVDKLADTLAGDFDNHDFRPWYCKVINEFGIEQVNEWHRRVSDSKYPGKLFSKIASEALRRKKAKERIYGQ